MQIREFQDMIARKYEKRDRERGVSRTFMWFIEEVGELATALHENDREALHGEFADVLAWLCTLASLAGVRMQDAAAKYAAGCPVCKAMPCNCPTKNN